MALINTTTTGVLGTTVYGDGAGALTVQKDGVTQGVYGNIPAFSAYSGTSQSLGSGNSKINYTLKEFDTSNCYDTSTYKFTPNVAGYYQINAGARSVFSATSAEVALYVYKNGSQFKILNDLVGSGFARGVNGSTLVYANGTTDYFEIYCYAGVSYTAEASQTQTYFQGFLVKAI